MEELNFDHGSKDGAQERAFEMSSREFSPCGTRHHLLCKWIPRSTPWRFSRETPLGPQAPRDIARKSLRLLKSNGKLDENAKGPLENTYLMARPFAALPKRNGVLSPHLPSSRPTHVPRPPTYESEPKFHKLGGTAHKHVR